MAGNIVALTEAVGVQSALAALPFSWRKVMTELDIAFQPVIHMRSARCHGLEALVRGLERIGCDSPTILLDAAEADGVLTGVDAALQALAIERFREIEGWQHSKLFVNVDPRTVRAAAVRPPVPHADLMINLEFSERHDTGVGRSFEAALERYQEAGYGVALDGYGTGIGGLKRLYDTKPDYLKVDRQFIAGIGRDPRRRTIVQHLIQTAHTLGILTVAVGIETDVEFYVCRDIGFDFAQGFLLAAPETGGTRIPDTNDMAERLNRNDRRRSDRSHRSIEEVMERLKALPVSSPKTALLEYFAGADAPPVAPVVDEHNRPLGMVRERGLKRFTYSRFGGELLRNKDVGHNLMDLVIKCPVCDVTTPIEQIIEAFSTETANNDGIILIDRGEYVGFLSSGGILRLVNEHNLASAADQNPLTRLPGNAAIARHIQTVLEDTSAPHVLVYFDFDNFKPFNDGYGFRQGDRAILMFADWLKAMATSTTIFAAHIGGDDFFLGIDGMEPEEARRRLLDLTAAFQSDAETLYDPATREAKCMRGKDREGNPKVFPLLSVTAIALVVPEFEHGLTLDDVNDAFAASKTEGKRAPDKVLMRVLQPLPSVECAD